MAGGVRAKHPSSSSPPSRSRTEEGRGGLGRRRVTTPQGSAAVGERGKTEGESRGSQPRAHLGPGLLVEEAPRRRAAAGNGGWGGGVWRLEEARRLGWRSARRGGEPRRTFHRRGEVGSGKKNLPGDLRRRGRGVAGSGRIRLGPWPVRLRAVWCCRM
jgi:hypothetical protein